MKIFKVKELALKFSQVKIELFLLAIQNEFSKFYLETFSICFDYRL